MPPVEQLGLIGNCQLSALVANDGDVAWCCLPRFDSEPVVGLIQTAFDASARWPEVM